MNKKPIFIIGAGGHARVLHEILSLRRLSVKGFILNSKNLIKKWKNIKSTQISFIKKFLPSQVILVNGIGNIPNSNKRNEVFKKFTEKKFKFRNVIHQCQ